MEDEKDYPDSLIDYYDMDIDYPYGDTEWVSECCTAYPVGELDMSTTEYGGPSGFCGHCLDNCIFIKGEI